MNFSLEEKIVFHSQEIYFFFGDFHKSANFKICEVIMNITAN